MSTTTTATVPASHIIGNAARPEDAREAARAGGRHERDERRDGDERAAEERRRAVGATWLIAADAARP